MKDIHVFRQSMISKQMQAGKKCYERQALKLRVKQFTFAHVVLVAFNYNHNGHYNAQRKYYSTDK